MSQPFDTVTIGGSERGSPNQELMKLTTDELKERARKNEQILRDLELEMQAPYIQQERLAQLERQFLNLQPGKELRVEAPVLQKIAKAVLESHEIDHQRELDALREANRQEYFTVVDPVTYLHADPNGLVMGRAAMPLDRNFIAQEAWKSEQERNQHPVVEQVRYAGHVAKPEENVECVLVKEEGFLKRQPVYPTPYMNNFWLNLDGHTRHDLEAYRDRLRQAAEDPVAQRVARKDVAGVGEDALPVDWVGQLKRRVDPSDGNSYTLDELRERYGAVYPAQEIDRYWHRMTPAAHLVPYDKRSTPSGFVMPSWMY